MDKLLPAFEENNIAIAFCADDNFAPCTAVLIRSILTNGSKENNYDFVLLHSGMSVENRRKLTGMVEKHKNASMRFVDVVTIISQYHFFTGTVREEKEISKEAYYRLLIPEIMSEYEKVLYLDGDMAALTDVAEIYRTELGDNLVAACRDLVGLMAYYNSNYCVDQQTGQTQKEYWDNDLGLKDANRYFNTGLTLFHIPAFRAAYSVDYLLEYAVSRCWKAHDQDILNVLCEGRVTLLEPNWNSIYGDAPQFLPDALRSEYQDCWAHPKIAHFAGPFKPWAVPDAPFQERFWPYAADTPYLEVLLRQLIARSGGESRNARVAIEAQFSQGKAGMRYLLHLGKLWLAYKLKGGSQ